MQSINLSNHLSHHLADAGSHLSLGGLASTIRGLFSVSDLMPDSGDDVTFTLHLTSTPIGVYNFELTRNGVPVPGATSSPWVITNWQTSDDGLYRWIVTDDGTGESRAFGPRDVRIVDLWILANGTWADDGFWIDESLWNDA